MSLRWILNGLCFAPEGPGRPMCGGLGKSIPAAALSYAWDLLQTGLKQSRALLTRGEITGTLSYHQLPHDDGAHNFQ